MSQSAIEYVGGLRVCVHDCASPWLENPETIVFHHGLGARAECWNGWINTLCDQYRLVFFDMRGHGESSVADGHVWTVQGMVDDLAAVVQAAVPSGQKFHLVGESIGGTNVIAYACEHSDSLASLTVSNGAHRGGGLGNLSNWRQIIDEGGMTAWSAHMMQMRFTESAISGSMWRWYEAQQAQCDAGSVLSAVELLIGADLSDSLIKVQVPTLLLHPDSSPFIPVEVMADLKSRLPNAQLNVFAQAKHGLPFSHAGICARTMRAFLST